MQIARLDKTVVFIQQFKRKAIQHRKLCTMKSLSNIGGVGGLK